MKFKIDENLPGELADEIRALGHDAEAVFDEGLSGSPDPIIVATAANEGRVLLTMDKGIGMCVNIHPRSSRASFCCARSEPDVWR